MPTAGTELAVWGLGNSSPTAAVDHFGSLYPEIVDFAKTLHNPPWMPSIDMLTVKSASTVIKNVDVAFVGLNIPGDPQPDLLKGLVDVIERSGKCHAGWKTGGPGVDRTRRVLLSMESDWHADKMMPLVEETLRSRRIPFYTTLKTSGSNVGVRITIDLKNRGDIQVLRDEPPCLRGKPFCVTPPRYIPPKWGWDIVVVSSQVIDNLQQLLDNYIQRGFNDPDIVSYSAVHDNAYVVVLKTFSAVCDFLKMDTIQLPGIPSFFKISRPIPLFYYNSNGLSSRFFEQPNSFPPSSLQKQVDLICDQEIEVALSLTHLIHQQGSLIESLQDEFHLSRQYMACM
ncbi:hypothetical protein PQX77_006932 [Marasmius sp. AFHP31]|nr:hypothetical protein PQX77_006932 [Marasmius sp. AFHP31]